VACYCSKIKEKMRDKLPTKFNPELTKISNYYFMLQLRAEWKADREFMKHEHEILSRKNKKKI